MTVIVNTIHDRMWQIECHFVALMGDLACPYGAVTDTFLDLALDDLGQVAHWEDGSRWTLSYAAGGLS